MMVPKSPPKSLVVIGLAPSGSNSRSFYRTLGSESAVSRALPQILPAEDEVEIALAARKRASKRRELKILTGSKVSAVEKALTKSRGRLSRDRQGRHNDFGRARFAAAGVVE